MDLTMIVAGSRYPLMDFTTAKWVGDDDFGPSPIHRLSERGPEQHGDTDRGYRLDPNVFALAFVLRGSSAPDLFAKREAFYGLIMPEMVTFELSEGATVRRLDCYLASKPKTGSTSRYPASFAQRIVCEFVAHDPTWYNPDVQTVAFVLGGSSTDFLTIPMSVPFNVGASEFSGVQSVLYPGTWASSPHIIRLVGPISDAVVLNEATGEKLALRSGITIAAGDWYDIDPRFGYHTVKDKAGANKIADLTADSDIGTWHLAPAPEAPGGYNPIRVTGSGLTTASGVYINYLVRYN
ncbi:MAG TPA: phage tail family protein [Bellilinea sp.]|nr:phage tail family protein [Bellilinea sp.]